MLNERAIQDVAMIARNGIDRIIALERQNKRLAERMIQASGQAAHFEREWCLRGDEINRLQEISDEMFSALNAALLLVTQNSSVHSVLDEAVKRAQAMQVRANLSDQQKFQKGSRK